MTAILALDLATACGWAIHKPEWDRPFTGSFVLPNPKDEVGEPMEELRVFLGRQHQLHGITDICFEEQHIAVKIDKKTGRPTTINMHTIKRLISFSAMVEWFAFKIDAACFSAAIGTWRKHFIGNGGLARDEAKQKVLDRCHAMGIYPPDDNAAEAFGVLDYYASLKPDYVRPWRDADFMQRAGAREI